MNTWLDAPRSSPLSIERGSAGFGPAALEDDKDRPASLIAAELTNPTESMPRLRRNGAARYSPKAGPESRLARIYGSH